MDAFASQFGNSGLAPASLEDYARSLGYTEQMGDGGQSQWYLGERRLGNNDGEGQLSALSPYFNQYQSGLWGSTPYATPNLAADGAVQQTFVGPDGRSYLRTGRGTGLNDQLRSVGGTEADVIGNDPLYGGGIETGLQDRWAAKYQKDGFLERIANNMPIMLAAALGGAAGFGAPGFAGEGLAAGGGSGFGGGAGGALGTGFAEAASAAGGMIPTGVGGAEAAALGSSLGTGAGAMSPEMAEFFSFAGTGEEVAKIKAMAALSGAGGLGVGAGASLGNSSGGSSWLSGGLDGAMADTAAGYTSAMGSANPLTAGPGMLPQWAQMLMDNYKAIQPYSSVFSGVKGLMDAANLRKSAAGMASSPFDLSGNRALANTQLGNLLADPVGAAQNDPAYRLRIQAAQRAAAPMGQKSGAMAIGAANASSDWYNQRLAQLGALGGAGFNPAQGNALALQGQGMANSLSSAALGSLGFGLNTIPPAMLQKLLMSFGG